MLLCACSDETQYEVGSGSGSSAPSAQETGDADQNQAASESVDSSSIVNTICVYVCGNVASPGVYDMQEGSRVYEAIEAAGGIVGETDVTHINMAQKLSDGQQITVIQEGLAEQTSSGGTSGGSAKVNINTASADELMTLSGIGESRAEAIIEYRTRYGNFESTDELMNISGIGEKMLAKIADNIEI